MKIIITILFLIFTSFSTHALATQKLNFVTDPFPPYYYEENGKPQGLYCELIILAFEKMNIPIEFKFVPWKRALFMAEKKISDGIPGIFKTKEREKWLIFPEEPISMTQIVIFHRKKDNFTYNGINALKGKKVGVVKGYHYGPVFNQSNIFTRSEVNSLKQNFLKLLKGRVDVVAAFKAVGIHTLRQMNISDKITYSPHPVHQSPLYLAFTQKKGNQALANEFSRTLREIKKSPECIEALKRASLPVGATSPCQ